MCIRDSLSGNELTRNSSGNTRSQSSRLAEALWIVPGLKSWLVVRELISTLKKKKRKKKNAGGEWIVEHSLQILAREEKATTTTTKQTNLNQMVMSRITQRTFLFMWFRVYKQRYGI